MLNEKQIIAIEMLVDGELTRTEIAKRVGVNRTTLYNWLDNPEFTKELDNRLQGIKSLVQKKVDAKLDFVIDKLYELANDNSNKRVQAQVLTYLADRALGKPTGQLNIQAEAKTSEVPKDVLESEFEEWESDVDEA